MFGATLLGKAWALSRQTETCPAGIFLRATAWLEEKYRQAPDCDTAAVIALQYLMLALRHDPRVAGGTVKEYVRRAARWREEAERTAARRSH